MFFESKSDPWLLFQNPIQIKILFKSAIVVSLYVNQVNDSKTKNSLEINSI